MKFTQTHEWIKVEGNTGIVGITTHAQKELGDIVYVELPETGSHVNAGQEAVVLESTKAAADVYSPVSGEIISVNETLNDHSEHINEDAENAGWLYTLKLDNPEELEGLMDRNSYEASLS